MGRNNIMKASLTISITVLAAALSPTAVMALPFEFGGKAGFESFKWQEFDQNGQQSVEEKGTRVVISGFLHNKPGKELPSHFIYGAELKIYSGSSDYQDNNPANADQGWQTTWNGMTIEGEGGLRAGSLPFAWDFIGKLGFDFWTRSMDGDMNVSTRDVQAEDEEYSALNLRLGTGPVWQAGNWNGQVIAGVKFPLSASVTIQDNKSRYDNNSNDNLDFTIDGRATPFFTFSNQIRLTDTISMKIDAYYDAYKFKRSNTKTTRTDDYQTTTVTIPESKQINYGIQGGVSINF